MKALFIGGALLAAALAGCGGKASFEVAGTISGLNNPGLVLQNGNETITVPSGAATFSFPTRIDYGTEYHVTIKTDPAHMTCAVINPDGSAGRTTAINVVVTCTQNTYKLKGTVNNLLGDQVVLVNGSNAGSFAIVKGATTFEMTQPIPVGQAYGLSVLTQPKDPAQVCTIVNGSGIMGDADRNNVVITCQ